MAMRWILVLFATLMLWDVREANAAWLGLALQPTSNTTQPGVVVQAVSPGSQAAAADVKAGDVILAIDGRPVQLPEDVVAILQALKAGSRVRLELSRAGKRHSIAVTLGAQPNDSSFAAVQKKLPGTAPRPAHGARLSQGGLPVTVKQTAHCSIFTPANWSFQSNKQASVAEALSPDRRMYAGWGVTSVDRSMQNFYGPLYGDPETSIQFLTDQILRVMLGDSSGVRYTSAPQPFMNYFTIRHVESARNKGVVFYKIYPGPSSQTYVESVYFAIADKSIGQAGLSIAAGVTSSIRCKTQLRPVRFDPPKSGKGGNHRAGCGHGEGNLKGYNKELGSQYAYSPTTGEKFLFDAATEWQENGPQGAGYYKPSGNTYEKLELGRDDDC